MNRDEELLENTLSILARRYIEDVLDDTFYDDEDFKRQERLGSITMQEIRTIGRKIVNYDILWELIYELIDNEIEEILENRKEVNND